MVQYPIFINCRDRLTCTSELVSWLEKAGYERIILIDNGSTYEPLLSWYETIDHEIFYVNDNAGQHAPWRIGLIDKYASGEYYVVTDPDIIPIEECPYDAIDYFRSVLDRFSDRTKAGFNLKIDDIPDHFKFKNEVINHEKKYIDWEKTPDENFIFAPIDTTFALYRPGATPDISYSCRTKYPYVARHYPWYLDSNNPGEEEEFYIANASSTINSWSHKRLPYWMK
jgi:hypothetical protein